MSFRMPQSLSGGLSERESALGALEAEVAGERAAALGRLGREVQDGLAALTTAVEATRPEALRTAADAVWRYFVQREAMGLLDHRQAITDYAIPPAVLAKVGAL